jgi:alpha-galactosidase
MPDGETEWEYTGEWNQGTIHGYGGIAANFYPERFVRLCANFANRPDETDREKEEDPVTKIAYIAAGSTTFAPRFVADIMTRPALAGCTLSLMDIDQDNLDVITALSKRLAKQLDVPIVIEPTLDRRKALDGANYVISTATALGGREARVIERKIMLNYGLDVSSGCTTGLGGVFRTMRYAPLMLGICRDMEELCPDAWLFHYANPTTTVPLLMNEASPINSMGLCHSVQHTAETLAGYIDAPFEETGHWVAGVNHQAWFLRVEWNGEDAYPLLFEKMQDPKLYEKDIVRFEMMNCFGYFLTESSGHNAEYVPYFRKNPEMIERYTPGIHALTWQEREIEREPERRAELRDKAYGDEPLDVSRSPEYCVGIINAMETNEPFRFNGNVLNDGPITNLPSNIVVEVPCLVDNMGIHPCFVGDLPPQCASLNASRSAGDPLAVKGTLEADRKAIEQAVALDPLTAALLTLDQIHEMVEEAFVALAEWLPEFK